MAERAVDACELPSGVLEGSCAPVGVQVRAVHLPVAGSATFDAVVSLGSPSLAVEAWSVGVQATGCEIVAATTVGTAGADLRLEPTGRRDRGWEHTRLVAGGATSATALSWRKPTALTPSSEPVTILSLSISGEVPTSGCATCTLDFAEGLQPDGAEPVPNVLTVGGRSYVPTTAGVEIQLCSG
jgi:hypothetical protein